MLKKEIKMSKEIISFRNNIDLYTILRTRVDNHESEAILTIDSNPKLLKKSRNNKQAITEVFSKEIVCQKIRKAIIGASYKNLLEKFSPEKINEEQSEPKELPWGMWVEGSNILITHKDSYYLRIYLTETNSSKTYLYSNGDSIDEYKMERLEEFLPASKDYDETQKVIVNTVKLESIQRMEFYSFIIERVR
jgi:hypothetical protein